MRRRLVYSSSHQADFHCDGPGKYKIPDSYAVFLHPGYSLSQHKQFLGDDVDLDARITYVFRGDNRFSTNYYADLDHEMLETVRRDWGIDVIECDVMPHFDNLVEDPEDLMGE
jgi:hypothetical protein